MGTRPRTMLVLAGVMAVIVFAIVQDRVTVAGARQYADLQRAALAGGGQPVTVAEIMSPAVRRSVVQGSLWGAVVLIAGVAISRYSNDTNDR